LLPLQNQIKKQMNNQYSQKKREELLLVVNEPVSIYRTPSTFDKDFERAIATAIRFWNE
jgi:hypothetical protein